MSFLDFQVILIIYKDYLYELKNIVVDSSLSLLEAGYLGRFLVKLFSLEL